MGPHGVEREGCLCDFPKYIRARGTSWVKEAVRQVERISPASPGLQELHGRAVRMEELPWLVPGAGESGLAVVAATSRVMLR